MLASRRFLAFAACLGFAAVALAEPQPQPKDIPVPDLATLIAKPESELRIALQRFDADRGNLQRFYTIAASPTRQARMKRYYEDWAAALEKIDPKKLTKEGQADYERLKKKTDGEQRGAEDEAKKLAQIAPLIPFAQAIVNLEESRQRMDKIDSMKAAGTLNTLKKQLQRLSAAVAKDNPGNGFKITKDNATSASDAIAGLRAALKHWYSFYNGYDPAFTWWNADLYKEVDQALGDYASALRNKGPGTTIAVDPMETATKITDPSNKRYAFPGKDSDAPDLAQLIALRQSELREVVLRFQTDRGSLGGKLGGIGKGGPKSPERIAAARKFHTGWLAALAKLDFDKLSREGQVDYLLVNSLCERDLRRLDLKPTDDKEPGKIDGSGIAGSPIGRDALVAELAGEMIASTPEELCAVADKEYAWCEAEMKKASRELGFGDDWLKAVEKVKTLHVEPGQQPAMIRDLAWEAIDYLDKNDLVSVPNIAKETWRMEMMTPQRQLVNPFFTGGEVISVSFPTNTMSYEDRLQSMRGNNLHFSRATVHHELIPGHHLQQFMNARYSTHRAGFRTPFWTEGWALYWEMVLYDKGFAKSPQDRVGFLFWRMHRCARIHFSLNFHLGKMTPRECIDYLVQRVGHEPANATAEVRRSFNGSYAPLYQAAYLLGGMQIRELRRELVDGGKMTERDFHDAVLRGGNMPMAMVRAMVTDHKLTRDSALGWKFGR
jgi:uncharacterized protein (DUF885 family)